MEVAWSFQQKSMARRPPRPPRGERGKRLSGLGGPSAGAAKAGGVQSGGGPPIIIQYPRPQAGPRGHYAAEGGRARYAPAGPPETSEPRAAFTRFPRKCPAPFFAGAALSSGAGAAAA